MNECENKKEEKNHMWLSLPALSVNEGVARSAVAAFCAQCNPTLTELADVKCALSEAVTNCIVHAYREMRGKIYITVRLLSRGVRIHVRDYGCGIEDVAKAREPLFTTDAANERSGMGFAVMESFMDKLEVYSKKGRGTLIVLTKYFGRDTSDEGEEELGG